MNRFSVRLCFKLLLISWVNLSIFVNVKCAKIMAETTTQTPKLLSMLKNEEVACTTHQNCSSRILTLDTYCCPSSNTCCNWFKFTSTYKSASSLPLKAPSILTILAILLFIISFLFVIYCFSILFCFCFKCGIFKRPKVIIMSQSHDTESGLFDNRSPKHSTSSTSSASSSSYTPNRRGHRQIPRGNKQYKKKTTNKQRSRSARSPTARAYSNKRHNQHSEPEIYAEFDIQADSDSPFLIPPELNGQVQQRMNRSYNIQNSEQYRTNSSRMVTPSAPLANDDNNHFDTENQRSNNILEPVIGSSLSGSTSSSLGLGQSLMEAGVSSTVVENTNSGHTSATTVTQATYHYHDDKPPSYEDIIKTNY